MLRALLFLAAVALTATSPAAEDKKLKLTWTERHRQLLRSLKVGWDITEVGAPCLGPKEYPKDCLAALQVAVLYGQLEPGLYNYERPPADHEVSLMVEKLPQRSQFHFTSEHRILLKHMQWEMSDPYFENQVPGCDPKRPYGNFTFYQLEMARHLGRIPQKAPRESDNQGMTPQLVTEMTELHHQMQPALQVFLDHFVLKPGQNFEGDEYGNWNRVKL